MLLALGFAINFSILNSPFIQDDVPLVGGLFDGESYKLLQESWNSANGLETASATDVLGRMKGSTYEIDGERFFVSTTLDRVTFWKGGLSMVKHVSGLKQSHVVMPFDSLSPGAIAMVSHSMEPDQREYFLNQRSAVLHFSPALTLTVRHGGQDYQVRIVESDFAAHQLDHTTDPRDADSSAPTFREATGESERKEGAPLLVPHATFVALEDVTNHELTLSRHAKLTSFLTTEGKKAEAEYMQALQSLRIRMSSQHGLSEGVSGLDDFSEIVQNALLSPSGRLFSGQVPAEFRNDPEGFWKRAAIVDARRGLAVKAMFVDVERTLEIQKTRPNARAGVRVYGWLGR